MKKITIEYLNRRIEETRYEQGMKSERLDFGPCRGVFEGGKIAAFQEILLVMEEEQEEETKNIKKSLDELYAALEGKKVLDGTHPTLEEVVQKTKEGSCK